MKAARNVLAIIAMAGLCWAAVGLIGWVAWSCIEAVYAVPLTGQADA